MSLKIITSKKCGGCETLKERLKDLVEKGYVTFMDVEDSEEARSLVEKLGIKQVPAIVGVTEEKICVLDKDLKPERCITPQQTPQPSESPSSPQQASTQSSPPSQESRKQ
jgi:hypothetical protein